MIGNRFQIVRKIGEGTFAEVYRARESDGRDVALKVLRHVHRHDPEIRERFRREAVALAEVHSPHVVALEATGSDDEPFIAMEYVAGPTLRELAGGAAWPLAIVHTIVGQIAQGVAAIHDAGVLHRDLKPENVVLVDGRRGRLVKLIDFGLAKLPLLEQDLGLTALTIEGTSFGTPQYMAPEQMEGEPAGRATDLWATAVIAYELLAGRLPWPATDPRNIFFAINSQPVPPVMTTDTAEAKRLDAFFTRALARDPRLRPADATQLFGLFEQALYGGPVAERDVFAGVTSVEMTLPGRGDDPTHDNRLDETLPSDRNNS
jgi:serine/threonine protein kinase